MTAPSDDHDRATSLSPPQTLTPLVPSAPQDIAIDFPGLRVGVAEYAEGPTGCTVLALDGFASTAIDVRGGIPGIYHAFATAVEAICLAGGSILGLDAASGVAAELYTRHGGDPFRLPGVTGGVIYDFAPPGRTGVYPDAALGRAALRSAATGVVPVGAVGAARSATCGKLGLPGWAEYGGQGAAYGTVGRARIVVVTVVNAIGVIVNRQGEIVRGNRNPETGERAYIPPEDMVHGHQRQMERFSRSFSQATTLTVVLTDVRLRDRDQNQLARQVHASLARAIHPFHCTGDGDVLWFLTTNEVDDRTITPTAVGTVASELAWDAVLNAVTE